MFRLFGRGRKGGKEGSGKPGKGGGQASGGKSAHAKPGRGSGAGTPTAAGSSGAPAPTAAAAGRDGRSQSAPSDAEAKSERRWLPPPVLPPAPPSYHAVAALDRLTVVDHENDWEESSASSDSTADEAYQEDADVAATSSQHLERSLRMVRSAAPQWPASLSASESESEDDDDDDDDDGESVTTSPLRNVAAAVPDDRSSARRSRLEERFLAPAAVVAAAEAQWPGDDTTTASSSATNTAAPDGWGRWRRRIDLRLDVGDEATARHPKLADAGVDIDNLPAWQAQRQQQQQQQRLATTAVAANRGRSLLPQPMLDRRSRSSSRRSHSSSDTGASVSPRRRSGIRNSDEFLAQLESCATPITRWDTSPSARAQRQTRLDALSELVEWVEACTDALAPNARIYRAVTVLVYNHLARRDPPPMSADEYWSLADDDVELSSLECHSHHSGRSAFTPMAIANGTNSNHSDPQGNAADPLWPHTEAVYTLLLEYLDPERTDTDVRQQRNAAVVTLASRERVDLWQQMVPAVLRLFNAPPYEREYVKACLHRLYARFRDLRALTRDRIRRDICLPYRFDTVAHAGWVRGLPDLLQVLQLIARGLSRPLKPENTLFYLQALLPLHAPRGYVVYARELSECALQFADREPELARTTVWFLLRHWPRTNCRKESQYLEEMALLLEVCRGCSAGVTALPDGSRRRRRRRPSGDGTADVDHDEAAFVAAVFRRLAGCVTSPHRDIAEESLALLLDQDDDDDGEEEADERSAPNLVSMGASLITEAGAVSDWGVRASANAVAASARRGMAGARYRPPRNVSWCRGALLRHPQRTYPPLVRAIRINAHHWESRVQQMTQQLQALLLRLDANMYETCLRNRGGGSIRGR